MCKNVALKNIIPRVSYNFLVKHFKNSGIELLYHEILVKHVLIVG
jgi:hypothetical protein